MRNLDVCFASCSGPSQFPKLPFHLLLWLQTWHVRISVMVIQQSPAVWRYNRIPVAYDCSPPKVLHSNIVYMQPGLKCSCVGVQDRKLNTEEGCTTHKYYTPTTSDLAVRSIRNWLDNMAGPVPWPSSAPADMHTREIPREELLDRYHQHTKHCKNCSQVGLLSACSVPSLRILTLS